MGWLAIGLRPTFFFAGGVTGAGGRMAGTRSMSPWLVLGLGLGIGLGLWLWLGLGLGQGLGLGLGLG